MKGIDVSADNHVEWETAKEGGLEFAMLRCGYGKDLASQDDPSFAGNVSACEQLNIPWGSYLYSYALNTEDARSELAHILRLVKDRKPLFPVVLDMEDADGYKEKHGMPSRRVLTDIIKTVCDGLKKAGYLAGYYVNKSWHDHMIYPDELKAYEFWYARPGYRKPDLDCGLWQNNIPATGGEWPGVTTGGENECDTDVSLKDYPQIVRDEGLNNWPKTNPISIDTTMDVTKTRGQWYGVKCTAEDPAKIELYPGTPDIVTVIPVKREGDSQFFLVVPIGQPGQSTGIWTRYGGDEETAQRRFVFKIGQ